MIAEIQCREISALGIFLFMLLSAEIGAAFQAGGCRAGFQKLKQGKIEHATFKQDRYQSKTH